MLDNHNLPKVSLIMSSFNCKDNIMKTFDSVEKQSYPNIEVLIADGGSTDGTVEEIKMYAQTSKREVKWVSEKDKGIYDAMNKGYRMSSGDIIACFNEEFVTKDAVRLMVEAILSENYDGAHADFVYATDTEVKRLWHMGKGKITDGWMPGHPTLYLKREVFEKYGLYRDDYKYSADYELMVRTIYGHGIKLAYVPKVIIRMYYGGTSTSGFKGYFVTYKEAHQALIENHVKGALWIDIKRTFRLFEQFHKAKKMKITDIFEN